MEGKVIFSLPPSFLFSPLPLFPWHNNTCFPFRLHEATCCGYNGVKRRRRIIALTDFPRQLLLLASYMYSQRVLTQILISWLIFYLGNREFFFVSFLAGSNQIQEVLKKSFFIASFGTGEMEKNPFLAFPIFWPRPFHIFSSKAKETFFLFRVFGKR